MAKSIGRKLSGMSAVISSDSVDADNNPTGSTVVGKVTQTAILYSGGVTSTAETLVDNDTGIITVNVFKNESDKEDLISTVKIPDNKLHLVHSILSLNDYNALISNPENKLKLNELIYRLTKETPTELYFSTIGPDGIYQITIDKTTREYKVIELLSFN